jgi:RNA polymerase sigma-70 factor (ECF subfamily)
MEIGQLVAEHHAAVYRYAYRLTGSVQDAEDLCQQVYLVAHEKLGQLRSAERARPWLFAVLRNRFLKACQKRRPIPVNDLEMNIDNIPAEVPDASWIDRERLQEAIGSLPPNYRIVLLMFYFEDRPYREIAEELDLPIGTVMSRLARAKSHLRSRLFEADGSAIDEMTPPAGTRHG